MTITTKSEPIPLDTNADGVVCVTGTRATLDTIVTAFCEGTAEEIVYEYPSLTLVDVYSVLGYYLRERSQVDAYLHQRVLAANEIRSRNEAQFDPRGIRDRLLGRRQVQITAECTVAGEWGGQVR